MKITSFIVAACGLFALTSCSKESITTEQIAPFTNVSFIEDENEDGNTEVPTYDFDEAIIDHVSNHSLDFTSVEEVSINRPDGTTETMYRIDGDIDLTKVQLNEFMDMDARGEKQYSTDNLVSKSVINVLGFSFGPYGLTNKMKVALTRAVANYNALNTNKTFVLSFGGGQSAADIIVYRNALNNNLGGSAQFPNFGNPGRFIEIFAGMETLNLNTNEHLMTHEMGHTMGLRHTDWFSRQSCGQNVNEGPDGIGVNYIPGTPFGFDPNSVMRACFVPNGEDGEFGFYDRVALEFLY